MTTVGEILKSNRERKKLTVEQVEKATKIRAKFILALEENQFDKLPGPTFARGFVKNYAAFLGLPTEEILAFYRRQSTGVETVSLSKAPTTSVKSGLITPRRFTIASISVLVLGFFAYLIFSYIQFAGSPALAVNSPQNNVIVSQDSIEVIGKTDTGATLSINNAPVNINEDGSFDIQIPVSAGLNTLTITASNKFGKKTTIVRHLRMEKW